MLGLLQLAIKSSGSNLQFRQRSARTWSFRIWPLSSSTLQDFSLTGINKKLPAGKTCLIKTVSPYCKLFIVSYNSL
jgi:hypothetical protein